MVDLFVSYMEMRAPPARPPLSAPIAEAVVACEMLPVADYLALYGAVGEPVRWDERSRLPRQALRALLADPATHVYTMRLEGQAIGLCEFVGVGRPEIELTNFGLVPAFQGRGLGPYLLDFALRSVWASGPRRIWLHTDTYDHPKARQTYERAGFALFDQRWETFPD